MVTDLRGTVLRVLELLIPDSPDGVTPGAASAGVIDDLMLCVDDLGVVELIVQLDVAVFKQAGRHLAECEAAEVEPLLEATRQVWVQIARKLGPTVLRLYFRSPDVRDSYELSERPPFPYGFKLSAMDFELLEPVVSLGKKYRDAEGVQ